MRALVVGRSMIRVDDGMKGTVVLAEPDVLRIVYVDRGEERIAGKGEKWEPVLPPPRKLRIDDMRAVARWADIALKAVELNQPVKWWVNDEEAFYDQGLVDVIFNYLKERK